MRKFSMSASTFYFMDRGEKLTETEVYSGGGRQYVIWPRGDKWDLRYRWGQDWETLHPSLFETENDAFLFAHEHLISVDRTSSSSRAR